jgi:hypothetical protein
MRRKRLFAAVVLISIFVIVVFAFREHRKQRFNDAVNKTAAKRITHNVRIVYNAISSVQRRLSDRRGGWKMTSLNDAELKKELPQVPDPLDAEPDIHADSSEPAVKYFLAKKKRAAKAVMERYGNLGLKIELSKDMFKTVPESKEFDTALIVRNIPDNICANINRELHNDDRIGEKLSGPLSDECVKDRGPDKNIYVKIVYAGR